MRSQHLKVDVSWVEEMYDMYLFYEVRNNIVFTTGVANFIGKILYRSMGIQIGDFFHHLIIDQEPRSKVLA